MPGPGTLTETLASGPAEWASAWLRHSLRGSERDFWAWHRLELVAATLPELAWPVVLELVAQAPGHHMRYVGAGPLEGIVQADPAGFVDRIEAAAADNPRFREALGAVWIDPRSCDPSVVARLLAASGGEMTLVISAAAPEWPTARAG